MSYRRGDRRGYGQAARPRAALLLPIIPVMPAPQSVRPFLSRTSVAGLLLSAAVALGSLELSKMIWFASHGLSALTIAIMLGIILGNTIFTRLEAQCSEGIAFTKKWILRAGIVLYGFRLTLQDIGQVGATGVVIDALMLASTFTLAVVMGIRLFKLDRCTVLLIGAGSSICGAAAIMATEPVVRGRSADVTIAISTVVVCGTIGVFLYPLLHSLNLDWQLLDTSSTAFGIYIGSTVHEVAQVMAAGGAINQDATSAAVITKMVRVMMLAPFLLCLSIFLTKQRPSQSTIDEGCAPAMKVVIPWFAFAFIGMVGFNSLGWLPATAVSVAVNIDTMLLAMAMAALGMTTHISAVRRAGVKPLALAALLLVWLIVGGAAINGVVTALLR